MKIKNLTFSYNSFTVFENFNFESASPIIVLKGPSGCGKTTLLKIISQNLVPTKSSFVEYSGNCYFVIQEDSLLPWLTGEENISKFLGTDVKTIQNLKLFPLVESFILKKAYEMSYGQRRMIELLRAIISKPDLLLLDEPFNFLDNKKRKDFALELLALSASGTKLILTSHYNEDTSQLNSEVFYFDNKFPIKALSREE